MAHHITQSAQRSAKGLGAALQEDSQRAANCFSVNSTGRLDEGIYLTLHEQKPGGFGEYPPHLKVGHQFILRNRNGSYGCVYRPTNEGGLVRRAEIVTVTPIEGEPFDVLNCPSDTSPHFHLLLIHYGLAQQDGVKLKDSVYELGIWHGVFGTAKLVRSSGDQALVRFDEDGQEVHVMYPNGLVRSVIRENGLLMLQSLSDAEMAMVRVANAEEQLAECDTTERGIKRRDGILIGMVKLLQLTRSYEGAREVILDFLRAQNLSNRMRQEIRATLVSLGDQYALEFADISYASVVTPDSPRKGPSAEAKAKKAEKAAKDRELRQQMRGNRGQESKVTSNPKKQRKRERKQRQRG